MQPAFEFGAKTMTQGHISRILPDLSTAFSKPAPAAPQGKAKLDWQKLDIQSLSPDLQELYFSYKSAEELATKARKLFQTSMTTKLDLPSNVVLRFGYLYGNLSVALDTDQRVKRSDHLSLSDLSSMIDRKSAR